MSCLSFDREKARASAFFALPAGVSAAAAPFAALPIEASEIAGAGRGAVASASTAGEAVPFFVCLAITSRRCCSRRRSSRQARKASMPRLTPPWTAPTSAAKKRPKENWVDMIVDSTISVSTTITAPVRFRYSDISCARNSPA